MNALSGRELAHADIGRKGSLRLLSVIALALITASSLFAAGKRDAGAGQKPLVAVSILPQKYFVERIAGERVEVLVVVGEGQSPHNYEPTPRQLQALSRAAFWVLSGTDFEQSLVPKIRSLYPQLLIVDGSKGVSFRMLEAHEHDDAVHGLRDHHDEEHDDHHEEAHAHGELELDRHIWLGREPAKIMAAHILAALQKADPQGAALYKENHDALIADIEGVFEELKGPLAALAGRSVLVFHPAFGYFLDEFGIRQVSVETGGKEPTPRALAHLVAEAREEGARAIFVQTQFPRDSARSIAESLGIEVLPLDPLSADWLANIRRMGETLAKAAGGKQ